MESRSEMAYDVFFYEAFAEEAELLKEYIPENIKAGFTWKTIQESGHDAPPAALISTRTQSQLPPEWAPALTAILSRSTGYDHLLAYREQILPRKVAFGYLPLYCHWAVAEQALLLWLALMRKLNLQTNRFKTFTRDGLTGMENRGKTLSVFGVGNIGHEIVKIGYGLEMNVLGVDIVRRHSDVNYVDKDSAVAEADVIVCAMNLTRDNVAYFDYSFLRNSKPGALFVNISRGEISPATDLLRLVEENHLGGVALDVYDQEKELAVALRSGKRSDNAQVQAVLALAQKENVILTPHNAFNTVESVRRKAKQSVEQTESFLNQGRFKWPVPQE